MRWMELSGSLGCPSLAPQTLLFETRHSIFDRLGISHLHVCTSPRIRGHTPKLLSAFAARLSHACQGTQDYLEGCCLRGPLGRQAWEELRLWQVMAGSGCKSRQLGSSSEEGRIRLCLSRQLQHLFARPPRDAIPPARPAVVAFETLIASNCVAKLLTFLPICRCQCCGIAALAAHLTIMRWPQAQPFFMYGSEL